MSWLQPEKVDQKSISKRFPQHSQFQRDFHNTVNFKEVSTTQSISKRFPQHSQFQRGFHNTVNFKEVSTTQSISKRFPQHSQFQRGFHNYEVANSKEGFHNHKSQIQKRVPTLIEKNCGSQEFHCQIPSAASQA
jgi:hypothetical protein